MKITFRQIVPNCITLSFIEINSNGIILFQKSKFVTVIRNRYALRYYPANLNSNWNNTKSPNNIVYIEKCDYYYLL